MEHRKKAGYQSCSRTDKGVSAIGNVASLKCVLVDDLEDKINEHLPDDIRITGVQRVTGGFDAKNKCSHRSLSNFYIYSGGIFLKTLSAGFPTPAESHSQK